MLELDGADAFRLAAYRRAAARIRESAVPVAQLAIDGKATRLSGIGGTIEAKIVEYVETGDMAALAKLRDKLPPGLVEVMHVPGLGPKTARKLWSRARRRVARRPARAAAEQERLRELPGLGAKTEEKVLKELGDAEGLGGDRAHAARQGAPGGPPRRRGDRGERPGRAGERGRERSPPARDDEGPRSDRDRGRPSGADDFFTERTWVAEVVALGGTKATVVSHDGLRFDLRVVPPECYGNLLQHFTGLEGPQRRPA